MSEPVSQAFLLEIMQQMETRVDEAHGRVRASLNELKLEMKEGFAGVCRRCEAERIRADDQSQRLLIIETQRESEQNTATVRKQDQRDRNVLVATLTSIVVTVILFAIKAFFHL